MPLQLSSSSSKRTYETPSNVAPASGSVAIEGSRATTSNRRYSSTSTISMACMREETFGPTLADHEGRPRSRNGATCERFRVRWLSASVFSATSSGLGASRLSWRLARSISNNALVNLFHYNLPQGGWKQSGLGSRFRWCRGLLKFCRTQAVVSDRFTAKEPYGSRRRRAQVGQLPRGARFMRMHTIGGVGSPLTLTYVGIAPPELTPAPHRTHTQEKH